ncbi:MAG: hypothetical protein ACXQTS_03100 [Candidatus Methanospirareceae archaeon]
MGAVSLTLIIKKLLELLLDAEEEGAYEIECKMRGLREELRMWLIPYWQFHQYS